MTVTHILKGKGQDIITLPPHRSMADAARLLAEKRIGAVVITGANGAIAGILSERDVVRALAQSGAAALDHAISKHMTTKVATGRESDTLQDLMSQMTLGKFRHVPIVEQGRLIGIVSIGDVVKYRLAEIEAETQAMRDYISA